MLQERLRRSILAESFTSDLLLRIVDILGGKETGGVI
jgi:hypothetical protein